MTPAEAIEKVEAHERITLLVAKITHANAIRKWAIKHSHIFDVIALEELMQIVSEIEK